MGLLQEGQTIRGTYEVERFLGEGAFAEVYRVKHRFLGRQAMKVFKIVGMTIEETEQMLSEAILLSHMGHPNIIRVFDANVIDTSKGVCGYFTMEYIAGGSLEEFWRSHGVDFVPIETSVDIIKQVCRGLAVAHCEKPPIIHRDIKPQNILVGYDAAGLRVRLSDFGLAKRVNPMTLLASGKGTLCFKAPEVFKDFSCDSCAGDAWSIGSTFYLLLTDRLPFAEPNEFDVINEKRFDKPIIPPSSINLQVDPYLDQIVFKSLSLRPKDRYQNSKQLLDDLEEWKPQSINELLEPKKQDNSSAISKTAMGIHSPLDEKKALRMAKKAIKLSKLVGSLNEAADLMEEAFNKWPDLRKKYEYSVKLWRKGITM